LSIVILKKYTEKRAQLRVSSFCFLDLKFGEKLLRVFHFVTTQRNKLCGFLKREKTQKVLANAKKKEGERERETFDSSGLSFQ